MSQYIGHATSACRKAGSLSTNKSQFVDTLSMNKAYLSKLMKSITLTQNVLLSYDHKWTGLSTVINLSQTSDRCLCQIVTGDRCLCQIVRGDRCLCMIVTGNRCLRARQVTGVFVISRQVTGVCVRSRQVTGFSVWSRQVTGVSVRSRQVTGVLVRSRQVTDIILSVCVQTCDKVLS